MVRYLSVVFVILPAAIVGQQGEKRTEEPSHVWAQIQQETGSSDWKVRYQAFRKVSATQECKDEKMAALAFSLLRRERTFIDEKYEESVGVGELYSETYYSPLLAFALDCYDRHPNGDGFRDLALGSYGPTSEFAKHLADRGGNANLGWLVTNAPAAKSPYTRANLNGLLLHTLERTRNPLSADRSTILAVLARALEDNDGYVLVSTASALGYSSIPEAESLLKQARDKLLRQSDLNRPSQYLQTIEKAIQRLETRRNPN